jgi:Mce-associated membrane protein
VEDQPAEAGDLTEALASGTASAVPTGKRGRHRMFRPRSTPPAGGTADDTAATAETTDEPPPVDSDEQSPADEAGETDATSDAVPDAVIERPRGRRRWFRRGAAPNPAPESTTEAATEVTEAADTEPTAEDAEATEATEAADAADAKQEFQADAVGEITSVPRKPLGKALTAAVAAAAVLFVAAGAFAGAMVQPYLADRALVDTKLEIARTAANAITTLWTYTPDNMDSLPDRSARYLAGDFEDQYRKYIDAIAPVNKQAKVSNNTEVVGTAVESLNGKDATAVVYTNTTNTSPQSNNIPSLQYLSYRLSMERHDSRWLITKMTTITSLNLSPRLG